MDRYYTSGSSAITYGGWNTITTGTTNTPAVWNGPVPVAHVAPPPPTPLAWLESEVDRVCGMTRGGLAA